MRRHVLPVAVAALLLAAPRSANSQRPATLPLPTLDEARPMPLFPALVVPFSIPDEYCRGGRSPGVLLRIFDRLTQPLDTLVLRGRDGLPLDGRAIRCGDHVARWDGTLAGPLRVADPGLWYLQMAVDTSRTGCSGAAPVLRTRRGLVPAV